MSGEGLQEHTFSKQNVGVIRVIGEPEPDEPFKVKNISFAEYEDLDGNLYPLNTLQTVLLMRHARTQDQAITIAESEVGE